MVHHYNTAGSYFKLGKLMCRDLSILIENTAQYNQGHLTLDQSTGVKHIN